MSTAPHQRRHHADDELLSAARRALAVRAVAYDRDNSIARPIARRPGHRLPTAAKTPRRHERSRHGQDATAPGLTMRELPTLGAAMPHGPLTCANACARPNARPPPVQDGRTSGRAQIGAHREDSGCQRCPLATRAALEVSAAIRHDEQENDHDHRTR